jgi:ABC-2 type transport system ATP-binding protein
LVLRLSGNRHRLRHRFFTLGAKPLPNKMYSVTRGQKTPSDQIIEVQSLTKKYGQTTVVDAITFGVGHGEIFSLLGPNGAGKTTTIKMLTTLALITSGKATVAGFDVAENPAAVRGCIGLVPQELTADNELNGMENLRLIAKIYHLPDDQARARSQEMLSLVDLESSSDKKVGTYSGGMRRRLQLAMGLIHSPKILFLDEPTLGLDIQTRSKLHEYIQRLNREQGLTIFMTTHYLEEAETLSDKIIIIDEGKVKETGSPSELKERRGSQILTLEVSDGSRDLTGFLQGVQDIAGVTTTVPGTYKMRVSKVENAIPLIVDEVTKRGLKIVDLSLTKPSLDQVFLEITGHSLRDSEGSTSQQRPQMPPESKK